MAILKSMIMIVIIATVLISIISIIIMVAPLIIKVITQRCSNPQSHELAPFGR